MLQFITAAESLFVSVHRNIRRLQMMALCGATPLKSGSRCRRNPVECTRTLLVRVLMGTQTFLTSSGTSLEGQSSFVRSFEQTFSFVHSFERAKCPFTHNVPSFERATLEVRSFVRANTEVRSFVRAYREVRSFEHLSGPQLASWKLAWNGR